MKLRPYQQRVIDKTYTWWMEHPAKDEIPVMVLPTGSGKSVVLAELVRLMFAYFPDDHPRTVVIVPSKELAEQNAEKLRHLLPGHLSVGFYSASLRKREADADVIVATIGSIYKHADRLGNIKMVFIDECHLVNPDGAEAGRYRKFLTDLGRLCDFRAAGCTATNFRGDGVWLTDGEDPLFTGVSDSVTMNELIDANFLAPLVLPDVFIGQRIDTEGISTTGGDYNLEVLDERVRKYLPSAAADSVKMAADRRKWIAFTPTVDSANQFVGYLRELGVSSYVVCGETPADERALRIAQFRAGEIRCLVTVLALATGFDVPDVDCVIWLRPTISPVLYVQGAGRGTRIAPDKKDCLWLDFSDTTERLGPIDAIRGRSKRKSQSSGAPSMICPWCGDRVSPPSLRFCPACGFELHPEVPVEDNAVAVSLAPVLSRQVEKEKKVKIVAVKGVSYSLHNKPGKPPSMRVTYLGENLPICDEWVCFEHGGPARARAVDWWRSRTDSTPAPRSVSDALLIANSGGLDQPNYLKLDVSSKYPSIIGYYQSNPLEAA